MKIPKLLEFLERIFPQRIGISMQF